MIFFLHIYFLVLGWTGQPIADVSQINPEPYFTSIIVQDIDTSSKWYSRLFDLEQKDRKSLEDRGITIINLINDQFHLELIEMPNVLFKEDLTKVDQQKAIGGFFKIGFRVEDFTAWTKKIENLKIEMKGSVVTDPVSEKKMVVILDPDGNRVQLFEK